MFELWGNSHRRNLFALLYTETPLRPTVIPSDLQAPRDLWIIPVSTLTHTNGRQPRLLKSLKTHNTGVIILSPVPPATRLASWPWWRHQMETFSALLAALCEGDAGDLRRHRAHYGITLTCLVTPLGFHWPLHRKTCAHVLFCLVVVQYRLLLPVSLRVSSLMLGLSYRTSTS